MLGEFGAAKASLSLVRSQAQQADELLADRLFAIVRQLVEGVHLTLEERLLLRWKLHQGLILPVGELLLGFAPGVPAVERFLQTYPLLRRGFLEHALLLFRRHVEEALHRIERRVDARRTAAPGAAAALASRRRILRIASGSFSGGWRRRV